MLGIFGAAERLPSLIISDSPDKTKAVEVSSTSSGGLTPTQRSSRKLSIFLASFASTKSARPPCRSYRNLITIGGFDPGFEKLHISESQKELTGYIQELKPFKLAYNDFIAMSKAALLALDKAYKSAKKMGSESNKEAGNVKDKKGAKSNTAEKQQSFIFERAAEVMLGSVGGKAVFVSV